MNSEQCVVDSEQCSVNRKRNDSANHCSLTPDHCSLTTNHYSPEAQAVFDAGRELWKYYFSFQDDADFNVNASFYDIRERFQGRDEKTGRMKKKSNDAQYTRLVGTLRESQKILAAKIAKKVYEYGFLK